MNKFLPIGKFSFGMGDRFARQARAQLQACVRAASLGTDIVPVWNKSNREHITIGSEPAQSRAAADAAVERLRWKSLIRGCRPYPVGNGGPFHSPFGFFHDRRGR